jgi:hypothetical protein
MLLGGSATLLPNSDVRRKERLLHSRMPTIQPRPLRMERSLRQFTLLLALGTVVTDGCTGPRVDLDLTAYDQTQDQRKIAEFYSQEAARLQEKSEELSARIAVYERLFGPDSDWVAGTRLLAQSYEEAVKEHERMAAKHLGLASSRRP